MNNVILTGRLAKDPEVRYTASKKAVASFSVAVDDGKTKDGDRKVVFVTCVAWEKTAEILDQYFKKGDGITLFGKIQTRTYEKDGSKRYVTEVLVNGLEFPIQRRETAKPGAFEEIDPDEELPF